VPPASQRAVAVTTYVHMLERSQRRGNTAALARHRHRGTMTLFRSSIIVVFSLCMVPSIETIANACTSGTWTTDPNEAASKTRGDWPTYGAFGPNGSSVVLGSTAQTVAGYLGHEYFLDYDFHEDSGDAAILTSTSITDIDSTYSLPGWPLIGIVQTKGATLPYILQAEDGPDGSHAPAYVYCPQSGVYNQGYSTSYDTTTSIALDASGYMFITGQAGDCSDGDDYPHGPCIQKNGLTYPDNCIRASLTYLSGSPGAVQVVTDTYGSNDELYALDNVGHVWARSVAASAPWTALSTAHCGSGSMKIDQIAAFNGYVYGLRDNSGSPGQVYSFETSNGSSGCWSPLDNSLYVVSIGTSPQASTSAPILAADASGDLYYYCQ